LESYRSSFNTYHRACDKDRHEKKPYKGPYKKGAKPGKYGYFVDVDAEEA
jgi:hypothetical protein